jgi:protein arginine kinase
MELRMDKIQEKKLKKLGFMLCEICSERQASYIISTIVDSNLKEFRACEDCATGNIKAKTDVTEQTVSICPRCHCSFQADIEKGCFPLLGCEECYNHFHDQLISLLSKTHGSIKHKGKSILNQSQTVEKTNKTKIRFLHSAISIKEAKWMQDSGPDLDVVVSSRIRLARNIKGFLFCSVADQIELMEIAALAERASAEIAEYENSPLRNAYVIDLDELDEIDCGFLMERHLISRDLAEKYIARKVIIDEKENISIMINEEDHIRLQAMGSGLQLKQLWELINSIDNDLSKKINYSFSSELGFLTSCPTNTGTGLRVSVMFHLPALSLTKEGKRIINSISNMGYAVRGMYGEGSRNLGSFYQISNEATLGQSEEEIIECMRSIALQIIFKEREERQALLKYNRIKLEDKVFRAYGILVNAKTISSIESLELLSWISLGISLGIIKGLQPNEVAKLLTLTRSAHLQKREGKRLEPILRDIKRAEIIGKVIKNGSYIR